MQIIYNNEIKLLLENNPKHGGNKNKKGYLTLGEALYQLKYRPKTKFLWNGIKENSVGLVFGPSKSGKSIFCENLGMNLAMGKEEFMGYPLDGIPRKVLYVGLEEYWEERVSRNLTQYNTLSNDEKIMVAHNFRLQPIEFTRKVTTDKNWKDLKKLILESEAEVVIIDSITRMNSTKLENSKEAEKIMQQLRILCHDLRKTIVCIHHTPKIGDELLTMDTIKGSSTFSQESDFAIGVRKTGNNSRYIKNVFFRYAPDDDEMVKEFDLDMHTRISFLGEAEEVEMLKRTDRRRDNGKRVKIIKYLNDNPATIFKSSVLVKKLTTLLGIKERQVKEYLSELVKENKIDSPKKGHYTSIESNQNGQAI